MARTGTLTVLPVVDAYQMLSGKRRRAPQSASASTNSVSCGAGLGGGNQREKKAERSGWGCVVVFGAVWGGVYATETRV